MTIAPLADALPPPPSSPCAVCCVALQWIGSVSNTGVFFVYDVSPFMVEVIPADETPLSHLLLRLCAVAGGAFAVAGIVDSTVFYVSNRLRRHGLLG